MREKIWPISAAFLIRPTSQEFEFDLLSEKRKHKTRSIYCRNWLRNLATCATSCVNVDLDDAGMLDNTLIRCAAEAVSEISRITPRGEGNFNFTVNFNCEPLIPYFPAGYHRNALGDRFVVGLETPDVLVDVLKTFNRNSAAGSHNDLFKGYYAVMREALQYHITTIRNVIAQSTIDKPFTFSGFDSSAAPSKNCASMVDVYEQMGVAYFGASGTVEASSLLTRVFKSIRGVALVGFSGLMLAVTEDTGLAQGTINGDFDIRSLLTYSAVCGIGLDTVPIPGDTSVDKISALMRDTGTTGLSFKQTPDRSRISRTGFKGRRYDRF